MKLLHTSDLHLGKNLCEESFIEDQKYILNEIINIIKEEDIKGILIPGDIYDKSIPSVEAVNLFDDFLNKLSKLNIDIFITSGNHDSSDRLAYGSKLFEKLNIHISTNYDGNITKVSKEDVDIYLLPFVKPFHLKGLMNEEEYASISGDSNNMMKWIIDRIEIDKSKKNIILLHQYITWNGNVPDVADSETNTLGTLDQIDASLFDDFDYVALGHVHRPQKIKRDTIRYSGTPLAYSFSEVRDNKSVVIIDTDNIEDITLRTLEPIRKVSILRGTFEEVMNMEASEDIIRVELLDENVLLSPMEEIKRRFPNAISLAFISNKDNDEEINVGEINDEMNELELFGNFFLSQMGRELSDLETNYITNVIDVVKDGE